MRGRLVVIGVAAITAAVGAQQAPAPTYRALVEAVQVDAIVTDRAGNPVRNLRLDDFELLEDGRPQVITSFSEVNIPINAPPPFSSTDPRPDVATNSGGEGRLYVIAVDEIGSDRALRARHFLTTFIQRHSNRSTLASWSTSAAPRPPPRRTSRAIAPCFSPPLTGCKVAGEYPPRR